MQTIIEKFQSGDVTHNQHLQSLVEFANKTADEFNEVMDALEDRNTKLDEQCVVLEKQHLALMKQDKDKQIYIDNQESLKKQNVAILLDNKALTHKNSVLQKELKAAKEQIKRNKSAMALRDSKLKKLESKKASNDVVKMDELNCIYSKGKDVLLIYPSILTLGIDGRKGEQAVLLYTNRKGCFTTCFLDKNNKVAFSTFIDDEAQISEQTRKLINKNCMQISDEASAFAESWLYRINVMQKMKINPIDLTCFKD